MFSLRLFDNSICSVVLVGSVFVRSWLLDLDHMRCSSYLYGIETAGKLPFTLLRSNSVWGKEFSSSSET
jgi:hypothetical protein